MPTNHIQDSEVGYVWGKILAPYNARPKTVSLIK